jgi:WD40 repeat protein
MKQPRTPTLAGVLHAVLALWALVQACSTMAQPSVQPQLRIEPGSHAGPLRRAAVEPGGKWLVTASDDKTARIWSLHAAEAPPRQVLRPPTLPGVDGRMYAVAVHPKARLVAAAGVNAGHAVIYLFDPDTGRQVRRIDARGRDIRRMVWTPDGELLVAAFSGDPAVRAFDENGSLVFEQQLSAPSYDLDVSADGARIAVSRRDGKVLVLRIERKPGEPARFTEERTLVTFPGELPAGVSFSPDGATLAVGFADGDQRDLAARRRTDVAKVHLYDVSTGRAVWRTEVSNLDRGGLQGVRFTRDGRFVYAAGTGYRGNLNFPVLRLEGSTGRIDGETTVSTDSIMDLQPLPDGRVIFTSFDGSWGVIAGLNLDLARPAGYATIRGAGALQVADDGRRVGWTFGAAPTVRSFDLRQRVLMSAAPPASPDLRAADLSALGTRLSRWEDNFSPLLDGTPVAMEPGEVSRTASTIRGSRDIIVGSSRNLRRLGPNASVVWRIGTQSEIRSLQMADGDRLVVTATSDGMIRWWRARDGELLLSLFASQDGRWVAWTESGFFDAGAGGESLVGWHVNRGNSEGADFFSISRFRASFLRPDVIDRVLDDLDVPLAVTRANEARKVAESADRATGQPQPAILDLRPPDITVAEAPARLQESIPPVLYSEGSREIGGGDAAVNIGFSIRAGPGNQARELFARIDGRPLEIVQLTLPNAQDGRATGNARLIIPPGARSLQLFARSDQRISEPLEFSIAPTPITRTAPKPVLYVLAVGVSAYERTQYNLSFPAKDARDVVRVVSRQKGILYSDVVIRPLLDGEARRPRILDGLKWLQNQVAPGDVALVFIAGHGINDQLGRYYFMPHEARVEQLRSTGVSDTEFRTALSAVKGKVYLFVDTCRAASIAGVTEATRLDRDVSRVVNDLSAPEHGVQVLASSSGRQDSLENPAWGNGAFTKALVEGLAGLADVQPRDGSVTFVKLDRFVGVEVRRLTSGRQTPVALTPRGGQLKSLLALVP